MITNLPIFILSTLTLVSCGKPEPEITHNFEGWEQRIPLSILRNRDKYLAHCREYRNDCDEALNIPIIIDTPSNHGYSETANGVCVRSKDIKFIVLDNKYFNSEYLLAHELGHCHLDQFHDKAHSDYSLMSNSHCGMWRWEYLTSNDKRMLYRELFIGEPFEGLSQCE